MIAVTETAFLSQVLELAAMLGWEGAHFRPAQTGRGWRTPVQGTLGKGWPDLVLVRERDGRLIFAELKAEGGKVTAEQFRVLAKLKAVEATTPYSVQVFTWFPQDFDRIVEALT